MSRPQDPSRSLVLIAQVASGARSAPNAAKAADPMVTDLPNLHHAEIATARRYADALRAAIAQRAYASDWRRFST